MWFRPLHLKFGVDLPLCTPYVSAPTQMTDWWANFYSNQKSSSENFWRQDHIFITNKYMFLNLFVSRYIIVVLFITHIIHKKQLH